MKNKNGLTEGAKRNAFAYYFFFIVNAVSSFVISPILLAYLGPHSFGLWKSAQKILDFASIADGRSTQALKWIIANQESSEDYAKKRRSVAAALRVWFYFLPILIVVTISLVYFLPKLINGVSDIDAESLMWVGMILGVNIVLAPVVGIPDAVLMGVNQGYKSTLSQSAWLIASALAMAGVAYVGFGVIGVATVFTTMALFNGITVLLMAFRGVQWFGYEPAQKGEVRSFFNFSGWVLLWTVVERGLLSLELILLGALFGPGEVTQYTFTSFVVQFGAGVALLTGSAVTPGLGRLVGMNEKRSVEKAITLFRELMFFVMVVLASGMILFNELFVTAWVGEKVYMGFFENSIIALLLIQLIHVRSESQLQDLSLDIRNKVIAGLAVTFLSVVGCLFLTQFISLAASDVLLIVFVSRLPLNIYLPKLVNRFHQLSGASIRSLVSGCVVLLGVLVISKQLMGVHIWVVVASSLVCFLMVLWSTFFLLLSSSSRDRLLSLVRRKVEAR